MNFTREQIEQTIKQKGYKYFEKGDFNLNIVGIRNNDPGSVVTNVFDDVITLAFKEDDKWKFFTWAATTDPGKKGVVEFRNPKGVGRLVAGQYLGVWKVDKHQGKYDALCQRNGPVKVYRDANKDLKYDEKLIDEGMFGINIHKAGLSSQYVENWSEGCQVFKNEKDFALFMFYVKKAARIYENKFSYTLLNSHEILKN